MMERERYTRIVRLAHAGEGFHMVVSNAVELGALVRTKRVENGLSQSELAELVGTTRQWLSRFEQGNNDVSLAIVFEILSALDIELTARTDTPTRDTQDHNAPEVIVVTSRSAPGEAQPASTQEVPAAGTQASAPVVVESVAVELVSVEPVTIEPVAVESAPAADKPAGESRPAAKKKSGSGKDRRNMLRSRDALAGLRLPRSAAEPDEASVQGRGSGHEPASGATTDLVAAANVESATPATPTTTGPAATPRPRKLPKSSPASAGYSIERDIARISSSTLFKRGKKRD